jgi:hypothetical protein
VEAVAGSVETFALFGQAAAAPVHDAAEFVQAAAVLAGGFAPPAQAAPVLVWAVAVLGQSPAFPCTDGEAPSSSARARSTGFGKTVEDFAGPVWPARVPVEAAAIFVSALATAGTSSATA